MEAVDGVGRRLLNLQSRGATASQLIRHPQQRYPSRVHSCSYLEPLMGLRPDSFTVQRHRGGTPPQDHKGVFTLRSKISMRCECAGTSLALTEMPKKSSRGSRTSGSPRMLRLKFS